MAPTRTKPVRPRKKLPSAVKKAGRRTPKTTEAAAPAGPGTANGHGRLQPVGVVDPEMPYGTFFIRDKVGLTRIDVRDILFIQAELNYMEVIVEQTRYVLRTSLNELLGHLPAELFLRINRGSAANVLHIEHIAASTITVGGHVLPLSRTMRADLLKHIQIVSGR
jgi:DNA-binding LytR/AlgR family response regulator